MVSPSKQELIEAMALHLRKADAFATESGSLRVLQASRRYEIGDIVTLVDAARTRAAELVLEDVSAEISEPQP